MPSRRWEKQGLFRSTACHGEALLDATGTESTLSQEMERRKWGSGAWGEFCLPECSPAIPPFLLPLQLPPSPSFYLITIKTQTENTCPEKNLNTKKREEKKKKSPPSALHNESCKTFSAWKILPVSFSYCLIPALSYTEWVNTFYKVLIHT